MAKKKYDGRANLKPIASVEQRTREERADALRFLRLQNQPLELRHWITKGFEEEQITKGSVEIPAWQECRAVMKKLEIDIEHPEMVEFYYRKLQKHLASSAVSVTK